MLFKMLKLGVVSIGAAGLAGGMIFGRDVFSYVGSSARSLQSALTNSVPLDFQIKRARDLLDDVVPEMQANIRLVAQQEVEIDDLRDDINQSQTARQEQVAQIEKLRDNLATTQTTFAIGPAVYTRDQVKDDLDNRLELVKEADIVLAGKQKLLQSRQQALATAMEALDRAKGQKALLEGQIAALEGQYRLLQASSIGTDAQVDDSKLAQTQNLITDIKKRLDTADRVQAYEGKYQPTIDTSTSTEQDVVARANDYLASASK